jgi:hypothetical protein
MSRKIRVSNNNKKNTRRLRGGVVELKPGDSEEFLRIQTAYLNSGVSLKEAGSPEKLQKISNDLGNKGTNVENYVKFIGEIITLYEGVISMLNENTSVVYDDIWKLLKNQTLYKIPEIGAGKDNLPYYKGLNDTLKLHLENQKKLYAFLSSKQKSGLLRKLFTSLSISREKKNKKDLLDFIQKKGEIPTAELDILNEQIDALTEEQAALVTQKLANVGILSYDAVLNAIKSSGVLSIFKFSSFSKFNIANVKAAYQAMLDKYVYASINKQIEELEEDMRRYERVIAKVSEKDLILDKRREVERVKSAQVYKVEDYEGYSKKVEEATREYNDAISKFVLEPPIKNAFEKIVELEFEINDLKDAKKTFTTWETFTSWFKPKDITNLESEINALKTRIDAIQSDLEEDINSNEKNRLSRQRNVKQYELLYKQNELMKIAKHNKSISKMNDRLEKMNFYKGMKSRLEASASGKKTALTDELKRVFGEGVYEKYIDLEAKLYDEEGITKHINEKAESDILIKKLKNYGVKPLKKRVTVSEYKGPHLSLFTKTYKLDENNKKINAAIEAIYGKIILIPVQYRADTVEDGSDRTEGDDVRSQDGDVSQVDDDVRSEVGDDSEVDSEVDSEDDSEDDSKDDSVNQGAPQKGAVNGGLVGGTKAEMLSQIQPKISAFDELVTKIKPNSNIPSEDEVKQLLGYKIDLENAVMLSDDGAKDKFTDRIKLIDLFIKRYEIDLLVKKLNAKAATDKAAKEAKAAAKEAKAAAKEAARFTKKTKDGTATNNFTVKKLMPTNIFGKPKLVPETTVYIEPTIVDGDNGNLIGENVMPLIKNVVRIHIEISKGGLKVITKDAGDKTLKEYPITDVTGWNSARSELFGFGPVDEDKFVIPKYENGTIKFIMYLQRKKMTVQINNSDAKIINTMNGLKLFAPELDKALNARPAKSFFGRSV